VSRCGHVHPYVVVVMVVRPEVAFVTIVERLRGLGFTIVDYDEVERRLVLRVPAASAPRLGDVVGSYANSVVFEVKAVAQVFGVFRPPREARSVKYGERLLFYTACGDGKLGVWGEHRLGRILLRLCRSALAVDPAQLPPTLCSFGLDYLEKLPYLLDEAARCFHKIICSARNGAERRMR